MVLRAAAGARHRGMVRDRHHTHSDRSGGKGCKGLRNADGAGILPPGHPLSHREEGRGLAAGRPDGHPYEGGAGGGGSGHSRGDCLGGPDVTRLRWNPSDSARRPREDGGLPARRAGRDPGQEGRYRRGVAASMKQPEQSDSERSELTCA